MKEISALTRQLVNEHNGDVVKLQAVISNCHDIIAELREKSDGVPKERTLQELREGTFKL